MTHPLALIAYKRPKHTAQVIEALRLQKPEPFYVFLDAAKDSSELADVMMTKEVVSQSIDWTYPHLVFQSYNIGLRASVIEAVTWVLSRHETVIVLEDDCVPGLHFMAYMNECLDRYAKDGTIISVGAYTPPLPQDILEEWPWDVYFIPRIETWGWATWKEQWELYEIDVATAYERAIYENINLSELGSDVPRYIAEAIQGKDIWSPGWLLASYLNHKYCVYPTKSHIQYVGRDGAGANCGEGEDTPMPTAQKTVRYPSRPVYGSAIARFIRRYYDGRG